MNPNVGKLINGNVVLDRATFQRVVEANAKVTAVNGAPLAQWGQTITGNVDVTDSKAFTGLYTSGRAGWTVVGLNFSPYINTYQDSEGQWNGSIDVAGVSAYMDSKLADPNTLFVLDSEEPGNNYHHRQRTLYYRLKDIVVPLSTKSYYEASTWVDSRAGVIFVFGIVFSALGAPVISSALSSMATGAEITVSVGATSSSVVTTLASGASQVTGNPNIAIVGKVANLVNGQIGGSTPVAEVTPMFEDEVDFGDAFGSFDYSSGESLTAFTDAGNVDYGFGSWDAGYAANDGFGEVYDYGAGAGADASGFGGAYDYNATAESTVSDYGSSSLGNAGFDDADIKSLSSGVSVASAVAKAGSSNNSVSSGASVSGGGQKYSQTATTVASAIAKASGTSEGSAPAIAGIGGLLSQIESALPKSFTGQLSANKTSPQAVGSSNQLLWLGAAAIGVALILHFKG